MWLDTLFLMRFWIAGNYAIMAYSLKRLRWRLWWWLYQKACLLQLHWRKSLDTLKLSASMRLTLICEILNTGQWLSFNPVLLWFEALLLLQGCTMKLCVVIVMFVLDWFHYVFDTTWEYIMRILLYSNTSRVQMVFESVFHFDTILV
jgi:hypothetical protein